MIVLESCPVCLGTAFNPYLKTRDFSISGEQFDIQQCTECGFLATSPRPPDTRLSQYYESPNYVSHADNPVTFIDRIYWLARQYALKQKYNLVKQYNGTNLLDYGCGTGTFLAYCNSKGIKTTGVEPSPNARILAQQKLPSGKIHSDLTIIDEPFDVITLWHVLEHVPNLANTITQLRTLQSPEGTLIIAVPNSTSWESSIYNEYWAAYDVPRHLWHFNPDTIVRLFHRHGLRLATQLPMKLDSYYISLLSEKYKNHNRNSINGMINAVKNGFISNMKARKSNRYSSLIYVFKHA